MSETPGKEETPARPPLLAEVDFAGRQIQGDRPAQEDCYGVAPPGELGGRGDLLVVVADGMGGHAAGEVASSLAVETFARSFLETGGGDMFRLRHALDAANRRIAEESGNRGGELEGMGTTLVAALVRGLTLRWISVGDSPLYLVRGVVAGRLNRLHSAAEQLAGDVCGGAISAEEGQRILARVGRGLLTSALVGEEIGEVDRSAPLALRPGDILVAATDGLNTLELEEIAHIAAGNETPRSAAPARSPGILPGKDPRRPAGPVVRGQRTEDRGRKSVVGGRWSVRGASLRLACLPIPTTTCRDSVAGTRRSSSDDPCLHH
jgi:serine/threonine protein phosphatase PrpC